MEVRHMTMGGIHIFHVTEVQLFVGSKEDAKTLSQTDADQHLILAFRAYIGDPSKRTTCEFEVEFVDGDVSWLPWSTDIFNTVQYEQFCRKQRELYPLLFTVPAAKTHIANIKSQNITTVKPGDIVFLSLRNIDPYWYDTLPLDDPYHQSYVIQMQYGDWVRPTSHKHISAFIPILGHHIHRLDNYFVTFYGSTTVLTDQMVLIDDAFLTLLTFVTLVYIPVYPRGRG